LECGRSAVCHSRAEPVRLALTTNPQSAATGDALPTITRCAQPFLAAPVCPRLPCRPLVRLGRVRLVGIVGTHARLGRVRLVGIVGTHARLGPTARYLPTSHTLKRASLPKGTPKVDLNAALKIHVRRPLRHC
jgi:hypothetical protein